MLWSPCIGRPFFPLRLNNLMAQRISSFLSLEEVSYAGRLLNSDVPGLVAIRDASFGYIAVCLKWLHPNIYISYNPSQTPILNNVCLNIPPGALVAVVGPVAAGKSSLLSAILGEIQLVKGEVRVSGTIAYTSQQHWIRNKFDSSFCFAWLVVTFSWRTVRENITFGRKFDENKYNDVLAASALSQDLNALPSGDLTEIGEQVSLWFVNLSFFIFFRELI